MLYLPCQTFITYSDSGSSTSSSGALGEVRVSGSTEFIVDAVKISASTLSTGPLLNLQTVSESTKEEFLLVEIVLFTKNALKVLENRFSEDVVMLQDVLYSRSSGNLSRGVAGGSPSTSTVTTFVLGENAQLVASTTESAITTRVWLIK